MTPRPRISVALCTYKGEKYIREQIASILAQTLPVDEVVLGDDSPDDATIDIVTSMIEGSGRSVDLIIRRHRPGLGVKDNFADAIGATTGDVIILSDQDDVWEPHKVERLVEALDGVNLVHSDARLIDAQGADLGRALLDELKASPWERRNLSGGDALAVLLRRNLVTGATVAVRGDFARAAMPVPPGWIHDEWLGMLAALDHSLRLIPDALTQYRQHGANLIGAQRQTLLARMRRMLAPDPDDDARRLARALSINDFARQTQRGTEADRARLSEAAVHQRFRSGLPKNRLARIPLIAKEALSGRYARCSRGILTVARDVLQAK